MKPFQFRFFDLQQSPNVHKFGTDTMLLGAIASHTKPNHVLDIGTGTGALSLMLAQKYLNTQFTAVDLNEEAIKLAESNFKNSVFNNTFRTHLKSIVECRFTHQFDLIVSNPPFFSTSMKSTDANRNSARHDDTLPFFDLIKVAADYLTDQGLFWVIIPYNRKDQFISIAEDFKLNLIHTYNIQGSPDKYVRVILCFAKDILYPPKNEEIVIREANGEYTEMYKKLTKSYHKQGVFND